MKNFTFLSLILLFLIKTQNIYAKESTFTVDNILVSSELTNINNSSREKYLNIGFKKVLFFLKPLRSNIIFSFLIIKLFSM